jgi:hypothetical protein
MIKKYRINDLTFWGFEKDGAVLPAANLAELLFSGLDNVHVDVEAVNDEDETANDKGDL